MKAKTIVMIRVGIIIMLNICLILLYSVFTQTPVMAISQQGSRGQQVKAIQQRLIQKGYYKGSADGVWGPATTSAVKSFQKSKGITADGVAGLITMTALDFRYQSGDKGDMVKVLQRRLNDLGYTTGSADGVFGANTVKAVRNFQSQNGLTADGVVGFATAKKLYASDAKSNSASTGYSDSDYQLLARIISAESRGEPYIGQVAVGAVIMNRVEHPSFPDTIAGVVYQKGAFTAITDGQINEAVYESSYRAAKEVLNGSDPSGGAIYYYNPDKTSNAWIRTRPIIKRIGKHLFCS